MAVETVLVAERGAREINGRNGPTTVQWFKDEAGRAFDTFDQSMLSDVQAGQQVIVQFEEQPWSSLGNDGQTRSGVNRKIQGVTVMGTVQGVSGAPVASQGVPGNAPGGNVPGYVATDKDLYIWRQTAGKCAAEIVGSLYAGQGSPNTETLIAIQQLTELFFGYFRTGVWTFSGALPPADDGIPY